MDFSPSLMSSLRGARRPRLEVAPPFEASYGHVAAKLMRAANKPLDPWQEDSCELLLAVNEDRKLICQDYAEWVARQNGKGAILEARALTGFLFFDGENGKPREDLIAWSAHEYRTTMEAFRRVRTLLRALGTVLNPNLIEFDTPTGTFRVKISNTNGDEFFERSDTEQRIKFMARSKSAGRGFTGNVQIVDETFAFSDAMQAAIAPTDLAVADSQTIYTSTPPLRGDTAEPMYNIRKRAEEGGDGTIGYRDWGIGGHLEELNPEIAALRGKLPIDVDDLHLWAAACPAWGYRVRIEKLIRLRKKLGPIGFAREVLGMWPTEIKEEDRQDKITADLWESLADPTSQITGPVVFAPDMPWDASSVVIAAGGVNGDGKHHCEVLEQRTGSLWVAGYLRERIAKWRPAAVLLDARGPIMSIHPDINAVCKDTQTRLVEVTGPEMARACGGFVLDAKEDNLRHLNQKVLNAALAAAVPSDRGDVWVWDRKDSSSDISPIVAATLVVHGTASRMRPTVPSFARVDL